MPLEKSENGRDRLFACNGDFLSIFVERAILLRGREALHLLLEAYDYAHALSRNVWDFALDTKTLCRGGLSVNDLRWLLCKRLLNSGVEYTLAGKGQVAVRPVGTLRFDRRSCFVLTDAGVRFVRQSQNQNQIPRQREVAADANERLPSRNLVPTWDSERLELRMGQVIVKQFKAPAPNQQLILVAFEEEDWPARIDDPLPLHPERCPKRRLHETINSLNRHQKVAAIRFMGDGSGEGIRWELNQSMPANL